MQVAGKDALSDRMTDACSCACAFLCSQVLYQTAASAPEYDIFKFPMGKTIRI